MNWLDIVLIGLIVVGALRGYRIGLFSAAINAAALIIGWVAAGQIARAFGLMGLDYGWGNANIAVFVYVVSIALTVMVIQFVWKFVDRSLGAATLGVSSLVDRVGGAALGVALGVALAGAAIFALGIFAYSAHLNDASYAGAQALAAEALGGSAVVPLYVNGVNALPLDVSWLVPPGLSEPLGILGIGL